MLLAVAGEDLGHRGPLAGFDAAVGVDERPSQPARQQLTDLAFAGAHETDQHNVSHRCRPPPPTAPTWETCWQNSISWIRRRYASYASLISARLSFPNFSNMASASTKHTMDSATTPAAGTAQTSLRTTAPVIASFVLMSTDRSGDISVDSGFIAPRTTTGAPVVTPPSVPPARLVSRKKPRPRVQKISSWAREPGVRAISNPGPTSTPLTAWMDITAWARRPSSFRSQCT